MPLSRRTFLITATGALLAGCSATTIAPTGATPPAQLTREAIIRTINETRAAHGRKPWTWNAQLARAAQTHATLMARRSTMSHTLGGTLRERVTAAGYRGAVGENLGRSQRTLEGVIKAWLNSPGHRSTLLQANFTEFGLAVDRSATGENYWALIVGGSFDAWR